MKAFLTGLFCGVTVIVAGCRTIPSPAALQDGETFPEWKVLASTPDVQRALIPMAHTQKAGWDRSFAILPVRFSDNADERASWDFRLKADLSLCNGIAFDFFCEDLSAFSNFSVYFQSGNGWYHAGMPLEESGKWQRIRIKKSKTAIEGTPAGWSKITAIRISCWRNGDRDTFCALAHLGPLDSHPEVLIIRADSQASKNPGEARGFSQYARGLEATLNDSGLNAGVVSDFDVTPSMLRDVRLACLPYNPGIPSNTLDCLQAFVAKGGKLMAFYSLPAGMDKLFGVRHGGFTRSEEGFQGFAKTKNGLSGQPDFCAQNSHFSTSVSATNARVIAVWRDSKGRDTDLPAITIMPSGAFFGHVWFAGSQAPAVALMESVLGEVRPEFRARLQAARWKVAEQAIADRRWLAKLSSRKGEHRAFWCHNPWGVSGWTWDEAIHYLKENGFNAIVVNLAWGASASYASSVLPPCPEVAKRGDALAPCLAACRKYGVQCNAWKVVWNTFHRVPDEALSAFQKAGRVQTDFSGRENPQWLCPSNPQNQDQEVAAMAELADKGVDGIHFDYIRYPDKQGCFCNGCRDRFEKQLGHTVANWPACTRKELADAWTEFRCAQINAVVRRTAERVHKKHPACVISAAVFNNWPATRESIGQDWALWCKNGWLDAVCPMNYTESTAGFRSMVRAQKRNIGKVKFYPGIGLCSSTSKLDPVAVAKQILAAREEGADGFTIFNYDTTAVDAIPLLHLGPTAK